MTNKNDVSRVRGSTGTYVDSIDEDSLVGVDGQQNVPDVRLERQVTTVKPVE